MSLQSPLGRVLGYGSAKEGVHHWWVQRITAVLVIGLSPIWWAMTGLASEPDAVREHTEQSFEQFKQRSDHAGMTTSNAGSSRENQGRGGYPADQYVIGVGQGDMTKGPIVCQRVSELSARTDVANRSAFL